MPDFKKIYIVLTEEDLLFAQSKVNPNDIVITDLAHKECECQVIKPFISSSDAEDLCCLFREWFIEKIKTHNFSNDLYGYVNNFYECTVRPVITYFKAIDKVVEKHSSDDIVFILPFRIKGVDRMSTYYMAEYESVGVHLYDRHSIFLPYIEDYIQSKNILINTTSTRRKLKQRVFNFFRLWGVLGARFLKDCKNNGIKFKKQNNDLSKSDYIFVVRTIGQSSTLLPFLKTTGLNANVIIADSNTDGGAYDFLSRNISDQENVRITKRRNSGLGCLLKAYLSSALLLLRRKDFYFDYLGISFNYNQAVSEIIAMSANLNVYKCQVKNTIQALKSENAKMLFSLEQKSPHAFIDVILANELAIGSSQIKQCGQHFWPIPEPVFSEMFLVDSPDILEGFRACWPKQREKLAYIGSFQGAVKQSEKIKVENRNTLKKFEICFFAGFFQKENIDTLRYLYEMDDRGVEFNLTVKLHPRDKNIYSQMFPKAKIVHNQEKIFSEFCKLFDIALTYPSSVISELLFNDLAFFIYRPDHKDYRENSGASDFKGVRTIYEKDELQNILGDIPSFQTEFSQLHENFIERSGIITDTQKIDNSIIELANSMRRVDN